MNITVSIPDKLAELLGTGEVLARQVLVALALEEYRAGRVTHFELQSLLGLETRFEVDGFLKQHGVYDGYAMTDFKREQESLARLGYLRRGSALGSVDAAGKDRVATTP